MTQTEDAVRPSGAERRQTTVEDVLDELRRRRNEFHEQRFVAPDFVDRLKEIGVYRCAAPVRFGGTPVRPADFLRLVEQISTVDGSAGWVASFGCQTTYLGSLPLETLEEIYADGPDVVFAGALFPVQEARRTPDGFSVTGRWKFASGCKAAEVICVGIPGDDSTAGKPRGAVVRPQDVRIVEDWDVVGMRATGSFDLVLEEVLVPERRTFIRGGAPTIDEPIYRYPTITYAAQALSVVSAGVARAALDFAEELGAGRAGITGAPKLADRAYYRTGIAEAEATLRSARAYFFEAAEEAWDGVLDGGPLSDRANAHLRLSAAHLARTSARVVADVVSLSGTAPIFTGHPLQDLLGDALVPQSHAFLSPAMYDAAGAVLMGEPPTVPAFR
ncbi:flavin-dependent monooxygenase [Nocardioides kongjuensis]|uniref:Alkylation response protein AidB-like acyl-CoA dehydrogenase n=1 Tax=Nocardioides kongjuensis TaxID=349522 RepID=A0A852RPC0_9ACTN|nr:flavin-dependent monooxygenase [Nocardioides kongjuensis]NYD31106.1 alkylation response protein AidB-like acyl-CoA dehydrogenase [Nocardioides kongjuensis]